MLANHNMMLFVDVDKTILLNNKDAKGHTDYHPDYEVTKTGIGKIQIQLRPWVREVVRDLESHGFIIAFFTAGSPEYAQAIEEVLGSEFCSNSREVLCLDRLFYSSREYDADPTKKDVLKLMSTVFPNVGDLFVIVDDSPKAYPESIQGHVYHIPAMQPRDSAMLDLFTDLYQFKMKYFKSYGNQVTSFQPHVSTFVDQMKLEALKGRNIGLAKYVVTGSRRS